MGKDDHNGRRVQTFCTSATYDPPSTRMKLSLCHIGGLYAVLVICVSPLEANVSKPTTGTIHQEIIEYVCTMHCSLCPVPLPPLVLDPSPPSQQSSTPDQDTPPHTPSASSDHNPPTSHLHLHLHPPPPPPPPLPQPPPPPPPQS